MALPDTQSLKPDVRINLTRAGVRGVKKLVEVARKGKRPIILISTFDLFVDLPEDIKGANLSRNLEAMNEVLEEALSTTIYEIEDLCGVVAKRLLQRHEYATTAEVRMGAELVMKKKTPITKMKCQNVVEIFAEAVAQRNGSVRKVVGAEVIGMTACPCSQEIVKEISVKELQKMGIGDKDIENFLRSVPIATHNQRGRGSVLVSVAGSAKVPLEKIIEIIESSMSSEIFELLKREDEAHVIQQAHQTPRFVEDCVRNMARKLVETFKGLPDDTLVTIRQVNEESIHRHDAFAERIATMKELREEIG